MRDYCSRMHRGRLFIALPATGEGCMSSVQSILNMSHTELDRLALANDRKLLFGLYSELKASLSKSWLVDKMLGAGEMSAWYGPPGCGKGVIIEDMGLHIAAGLDWHGRAITRGAVFYIALERRKLVERRAIA